MNWRQIAVLALFCSCGHWLFAQVQAPVFVNTNVTIRVACGNLTSGNYQRYEGPGVRIFKGLHPDVVAVQEFNYASTNGLGTNTPAALREMIDAAFGTNYTYFREAGKNIPNGVISRFAILTNGTWVDPQVSDRSFVWAKLDLPGTNDLYVVSVHLHSSGGASSRLIESTNIKADIQATFPSNAFVVLAGDFNTDSRTESCMTTFTSFLSDSPVPDDAAASPNQNTNEPRNKPYDYVLPSFSLATNQVATVIGARSLTKGLVFDSRVYSPLTDVSPVQLTDSGASNMQHMSVIKDFRISYATTNYVTINPPSLSLIASNRIRWPGVSNVTYTVQTSGVINAWAPAATVTSATTNFAYTNLNPGATRLFYRVVYP